MLGLLDMIGACIPESMAKDSGSLKFSHFEGSDENVDHILWIMKSHLNYVIHTLEHPSKLCYD